MQSLIPKIESHLASLPVPVALALPDGRRVDVPGSRVTLSFSRWTGLAKLAASQIGAVGEEFVEGRLHIEGTMRDLFDVAVGLLPGNPAETDLGWWGRMLRRAKSRGAHSQTRDAEQVQFHYDVSDDFYALWLDPRRVYSCAYFRDAGTDAGAGPGSQARPHLPQADAAPGRALPRHRLRAGARCCCGRPSTTASMPPASRCRRTSMPTCSS